jgi:hypothetical protein
MKLCSYVMTHDFGFAPNPFGGYCTLAACTPNHCLVKLDPGDWLVGHSSMKLGRKLIYAMEILQVLSLAAYYQDPRFQHKKPRFDRTLQEACGDNIYYEKEDGVLERHRSGFHIEKRRQDQDKNGNRVFIADHFFYFGRDSEVIPGHLTGILRKGPGCKCDHPEPLVRAFVEWVEEFNPPGRRALPRDFEQTLNYLPQGCKDAVDCGLDIEAEEETVG